MLLDFGYKRKMELKIFAICAVTLFPRTPPRASTFANRRFLHLCFSIANNSNLSNRRFANLQFSLHSSTLRFSRFANLLFSLYSPSSEYPLKSSISSSTFFARSTLELSFARFARLLLFSSFILWISPYSLSILWISSYMLIFSALMSRVL